MCEDSAKGPHALTIRKQRSLHPAGVMSPCTQCKSSTPGLGQLLLAEGAEHHGEAAALLRELDLGGQGFRTRAVNPDAQLLHFCFCDPRKTKIIGGRGNKGNKDKVAKAGSYFLSPGSVFLWATQTPSKRGVLWTGRP